MRRASPPTILAVATLLPPPGEPLLAQLDASSPVGRSGQLLRMDRLCGLALCAADRALLSPAAAGRFDPGATAIVVGTSYGCHQSDEAFFRSALAGQPGPRLFAYTLPSSPVGEVSIHHGLFGPGLSIVTGRTAGLEALAQAEELLRLGQAQACLVVGCEVAAPAVCEHLEDAELRDGAAAILLGLLADDAPPGDADLGHIVATTTLFMAGDPAAAVAACVAELADSAAGARLICDPQTRRFVADALGAVEVVETPPVGAVAGLAVIATLPSRGAESCLVVSADPCGLAAGALWRR